MPVPQRGFRGVQAFAATPTAPSQQWKVASCIFYQMETRFARPATGSGASPATRAAKDRPATRLAAWLACATALCGGACEARTAADGPESVVLVHGLGRTEHSMAVLAQRLRWAGYEATAFGYDSRLDPVARQAAALEETVARCCAEARRVHFVGHSLGGIVIRSYLAASPPDALGRVVLLAPPSQGSKLADWLREVPLASEALGPAGRALGTDESDVPAGLPPPAYEMGIVAGDRSFNALGSAIIEGPDDGIVALGRTRVEGVPMIVLPRSHAFIMNSRHAARAVVQFLRTGTFEAKTSPAPPGGVP